MLCERYK